MSPHFTFSAQIRSPDAAKVESGCFNIHPRIALRFIRATCFYPAFISIFALTSINAAADDNLELVLPPESQFVAKQVDLKLLYANFRGQALITGKLVAQWIVDDDDVTNLLQIRLLPDEKSVRELPHLGRYNVKYISLENGKEALRAAIGKRKSAQVEQKRVDHISATGSFLIENYAVGTECDQTWTSARIVKSHILKPISLVDIVERYGC